MATKFELSCRHMVRQKQMLYINLLKSGNQRMEFPGLFISTSLMTPLGPTWHEKFDWVTPDDKRSTSLKSFGV